LFTAFMRRIPRWAFVAWVVVAAGGCAAVTGLDSLQEQDCAPNCGDAHTADVVTGDHTATPDVQQSETSSGDDTTIVESSAPEAAPETGTEAGHDASSTDAPAESSAKDGGEAGADASDAAKETGPEAGTDATPDVVVTDTGVDAPETGCGATNTLQNCGACGQACSTGGTNGVKASGAGCTGTTCLYQCNTGFLDCNASVSYDPDGCECDTTLATTAACCGTACPVAHITGQNMPADAGAGTTNFYDCTPSGTYSQSLAVDACNAYFGPSNFCANAGGQCTNSQDAGTGDFVICGSQTATSECICWEYQGPNVGKVTTATGIELGNCICPGSVGTGVTTYSWH
jgi:hypothetical protein